MTWGKEKGGGDPEQNPSEVTRFGLRFSPDYPLNLHFEKGVKRKLGWETKKVDIGQVVSAGWWGNADHMSSFFFLQSIGQSHSVDKRREKGNLGVVKEDNEDRRNFWGGVEGQDNFRLKNIAFIFIIVSGRVGRQE